MRFTPFYPSSLQFDGWSSIINPGNQSGTSIAKAVAR
jgi:hypothetical protein